MHLVCPSCAAKNRVPESKLHDNPICGKCRTVLMAATPVDIEDATLPAWCGPCQQMAPHFASAAHQLPDVRFAKVDSDAAPRSSATYGIRSIPTLILFSQGIEVARRSGAMPSGELVTWVRQNIA